MAAFDLLSALLDDCMEELRNRTVIATEGEVRELWAFEGKVPEAARPLLLGYWDEVAGETDRPRYALEVVGFRAEGSVTFKCVLVGMFEAMIGGTPMAWGRLRR